MTIKTAVLATLSLCVLSLMLQSWRMPTVHPKALPTTHVRLTSCDTVPLIVSDNNFIGISIDTPQYRLDVNGSSTGNPIRLKGLLPGNATDSLVSSQNGVLKRIAPISGVMDSLASLKGQIDATNVTKANITDIGKGSSNYYYVNKRIGVTVAQQDSQAVRGSTAATFRNVYLARNAAIRELRNGTVTSAVVYVYFGNKVKIAEDTCTRSDIDYRVPVGINANKFYASYDSDSTSSRTTNLGFANLFYIFEDNTKIDNYCSSQSRLCDDNINSVVGMSNFGFQNLDYESYYGQNYDGSENKRSQEINVNSKSLNVILRFKNYLCRRDITPVGGNGLPLFEVTGKYWTKTFQTEQNIGDTTFAIRTFNVGDYRIGGDFNGDPTFSCNDLWAGNRYYNMQNATVNYTARSIKNADGSNFIGIYSLYGLYIKNSTLNFNIGTYEQQYQRAFNHLNVSWAKNTAMFGFGGPQQLNKYAVNINIDNLKSEMPFITNTWGGLTDSVTYAINVKNGQFDATYNGSTNLSTNSVINLFMINKGSTMTISGNYTCKGYANMINIAGGSGTIVLNGAFKTLDDKPVINVTSEFTGKLIINGQLIVGRDVTSPTAASITGTGTAIIQSAISNRAANATILGNVIAVNSAFK